MAIGIALSPIPIIAVVLMLTTPRARSNGPAFVGGWLLGLAIVGVIVLAIIGPSSSSTGQPATWVSVVKIVLGVLLFLVALQQFRRRPRHGDQTPMPRWMGTIDRFKPVTSVGAGAVLAGANPKNLLLAVGGAATIAQTGIAGGKQALAYIVFALVATIGVGAPVVIYFAMGERSAGLLAEVKEWMGRYNAVIMSVLCLVIGVKLIGDAISGLAS